MNLPKHIEERLDEKFKDVEFIIFERGEWSHDIKTRYTTDEIKSFIAQILEEEKKKIAKSVLNVIITCYGHSKGENIQGLCDYCTLELTKMLKK